MTTIPKILIGCLLVLMAACGQENAQNAEEAAEESQIPEGVPVEENGFVAVEAEGFISQEKDDIRKWYLFTETETPEVPPDHDGSHVAGASGNAYLEILPDTRTNHDEKLIRGENFTNVPGEMGILRYQVYFKNPGKYYVWVRTYASNTEDNGIHVGIDGEWPETGQRMQFWGNKKEWSWESRQRTEEVHTGVEKLIYLEVDTVGLHEIAFSMREDGFEFDKWAMSKEYVAPSN